jgi:two-component system response regulator DegU
MINILLMGNYVLDRKAYCALLEPVKDICVVADVDNPADAISLFDKVAADILLIESPNPTTGLETVAYLQQCLPSAKAVLLTRGGDEDFEARAIRLGARGCVSKASEPLVLERALRAVAAGELWIGRQASTRIISRLLRRESPDGDAAAGLTRREFDILTLVAEGCQNKEIASRLSVSQHTVKTHLVSVYKKLKVDGRFAAAMYYFQLVERKVAPDLNGSDSTVSTDAGVATRSQERRRPPKRSQPEEHKGLRREASA